MASYYDETYDSRSRPSRRQDTYLRPRDEQYLKSTAGASDSRRRVGENASDSLNSRDSRRQGSAGRYVYDVYDTRYDYPPPLPPDTGRPEPRRSRSRLRKKRSYPPPPSCEDEVTSLAREAGSQRLIRELGKNDVPSRGKIDQETLLDEVPELINKDERRFVMREHDRNGNQPTPPTSEDEKARRRAKRRPSKLDMNFKQVDNAVPELHKRTASPYAFAKSNEKSSRETPGARFLSPDDLLSPPPTESKSGRRMQGSRSQPSSPQRDSDRHSPSSASKFDYFSMSRGNAIDDSDQDRARKPKGKAATHPSSRNYSSKTDVVDFAPQPASASIRTRHLDARRNTDTASTLPTLQRFNAEKLKVPAPLAAATTLSGVGAAMSPSPHASLGAFDNPPSRSRESSYVASRGPSPASSAVGPLDSTTPQRSPRVSAEFYKDDIYDRPPTRESSVSSSRPQSPSPLTPSESPRLPKTELDWSTLLAANAGRRNTRRSRLSAEIPAEPSPPPSRGYMRQAMATSRVDSLPYPLDDGPATPSVWMPSERTHQFFPDQRQAPSMPFREEPRSMMDSPTPPLPPAGSSTYSSSSNLPRPTRPGIPTRYSTADLPDSTKSLNADTPRVNESRRAAFATSSQTKKDLAVLLKRPLPPCSRIKPVAGYTEWYVLGSCENLNFCSDCVTDVFDRTIFRNHFRRAPPYNLDKEYSCALGGMPWIRLAWLMSLQQQRTDLNLMYDMADVEASSTACSGEKAASRTWYGLRNKHGHFVRDFKICYADVRKVEVLLPTLNGMFVRLPQRAGEDVGICDIRNQGNRFSIYIDALIKTHEKASGKRDAPDMGPFISLVEWRSETRECTKDALIKKGLWHFMPELPELTVCEDCYLTIIDPHLQNATTSSTLAHLFNRTLQPTPPTTSTTSLGSSCQLYSPRMRRVFARALQDDDFKYLARKARERRNAEVRLQERFRGLEGRLKRERVRGAERGRMDVEEVAWLEREMKRVGEEWRGWE